MKNILNPLNESISTLIAAINTTREEIYSVSNLRKYTLQRAIADMQEARDVMLGYAELMSGLSEVANDAAEDMYISADHVSTFLTEMDVFTAPIESFDGYCDRCGKELDRNDEQYMDEDADGWICENCEQELHPAE